MKRISLLLAFSLSALFLCSNAIAQQQKHSKLKIYADAFGLESLEDAGICVDHGVHKKGVYFICDFSEEEVATISRLGFSYDVLVDDVFAHYQKTKNDPVPEDFYLKGNPCGSSGSTIIDYPTPTNWSLGSMGGFHTYSEILAHLDQMAAQYPSLITVKAPITPTTTEDGNLIYYVKLSDNPTVDETEPEVLYTSLIHAREPLAGAQMIYYLWYLLENYATDPEVQYLVDNTEMFFVPVINPDGYLYNEQIAPNGGGLWRKNRKPFGGGDFGVDLNRNFSYEWNTTGTSNNPGNNSYCGPSPFSEVETQTIKTFCENREFKLALNYHSYGSLLLFPFGHQTIQTPDFDYQDLVSGIMVEQNGYANILSADLYPASGDADDWMYADDLATKPKIFAFTPEVAGDDFWFQQSLIEPYCEGMVYQNLQAAWLVTRYAIATDLTDDLINTTTLPLDYEIQRVGLEDGGTYTVSITPISPLILSVGTNVQHTLANPMDTDNGSIAMTLDPSIQIGNTFSFVLEVDNGLYVNRDTITKTFGSGTVLFADNAGTATNWTGGWSVTTNSCSPSSASFHDSPGGDYSNNDVNEFTLNNSVDLTNATLAMLTFTAQWDIEADWDYCQLLASTDGNNWTPLCGKYTRLGSSNQDTGNPLWDGTQSSCVQEQIDLSDYLGQTIELRFAMVSDQAVTGDGFYADDIEVVAMVSNGIEETQSFSAMVEQNMPNPANEYTVVNYSLPAGKQSATLLVYDGLGQLVMEQSISGTEKYVRLNTAQLSEGIYLYTIRSGNQQMGARRLTVVH